MAASTKLASLPVELKSIAGLCSPVMEVHKVFLAGLSESHFYDKLTRETYLRIRKYLERYGEPPEVSVLQEDIGLSQLARDLLASAPRPPKTLDSAQIVMQQSRQLRDVRMLYKTSRAVLESLEDPSIAVDELVDFVSDELEKLKKGSVSNYDLLSYGRDGNADDTVAEILYGELNDNVIPTGFASFDDVNGGIFRGSLAVIGGSSGGGKSLLANQLCINQARLGYKSTLVPLEMSIPEVTSRILANVSGFDSISIFLKRLATGERDLAYKRYRRFHRECQKAGGRYSLWKPTGGMTIEQVLNGIDSLHSDIVYVDYISLLDGTDGDDQWRVLGKIARYSKIMAERKKNVICLLAQVSEEGKLRYSQAVKEHASLAWTFVATKQSRDAGFITVDMLKGRNQVMRPFTLKVDYSTMLIRDPSPEELASFAPKEPAGAGKVLKKQVEPIPDLAEQ